MDEITKEYAILFNGITKTISDLEYTVQRLKSLQQAAEATYIDNCHKAEEEEPGMTEKAV